MITDVLWFVKRNLKIVNKVNKSLTIIKIKWLKTPLRRILTVVGETASKASVFERRMFKGIFRFAQNDSEFASLRLSLTNVWIQSARRLWHFILVNIATVLVINRLDCHGGQAFDRLAIVHVKQLVTCFTNFVRCFTV